jgi:hypothetical protein
MSKINVNEASPVKQEIYKTMPLGSDSKDHKKKKVVALTQ